MCTIANKWKLHDCSPMYVLQQGHSVASLIRCPTVHCLPPTIQHLIDTAQLFHIRLYKLAKKACLHPCPIMKPLSCCSLPPKDAEGRTAMGYLGRRASPANYSQTMDLWMHRYFEILIWHKLIREIDSRHMIGCYTRLAQRPSQCSTNSICHLLRACSNKPQL